MDNPADYPYRDPDLATDQRVEDLLSRMAVEDKVQTVFGELEPQGTLPFDVPFSMQAVEESRPDTPFDTADPTFRFGFGLRFAR